MCRSIVIRIAVDMEFERQRQLVRSKAAEPQGIGLEPPNYLTHTTAKQQVNHNASCACGGGCPACQAKSHDLKVSQPNDPAEIEADQIADKVMRMPSNALRSDPHPRVKPDRQREPTSMVLHRKCDACEEDEEQPIQRKAVPARTGEISSRPGSHVRDALSSGGRPLDRTARDFFEPRFGYDLGSVRVHTGSSAESSAMAVDARAYTLGNHIVFGNGEYRPESESGRYLLAHELAHVVQDPNSRLASSPILQRQPRGKGSKSSEPSLKDAELVMRSIMEIINGVDRSNPANWKGSPVFTKYRDLFVLWYELTQGKASDSGAKLEGAAFLSRFEEAKKKTEPILNIVLKHGGGTSKQLLVDKYQPKVIEFEKRADSEKRIAELAKADTTAAGRGTKRLVKVAKRDAPWGTDTPSVSSNAYTELALAQQPAQSPQDYCSLTASDPQGAFRFGTNDPLYFAPVNQFEEGCASCHPNVQRPQAGPVPKPKKLVTEPALLDWAAEYVWVKATDKGKRKRPMFRLLQYKEDKLLDAAWDSYRGKVNAILTELHVDDVHEILFDGSRTAKCRFAAYLNTNWPSVKRYLSNRAEDLFVQEIRTILHTGAILPGSSLITDPIRIRRILENPKMDEVPLGRWGATAKTGFEWGQKRLASVEYPILFYELVKHKEIYFEVSIYDFLKTDPFIGKVASDVVKNTEGMVIVGRFIKGFLNTLVSPVIVVLDTAAKVLDMATMAASYVSQEMGWHDFGYTCLSSTCRNYESCIENGKGEKCATEALQAAVEEATIIVPIIRQADECFSGGDPEACGGIAAAALGLVKLPGGKGPKIKTASPKGAGLSKAAYQEVLIRDAIKRPREGDPAVAKAFEEPKGRGKSKPTAGEILTAADEIRKTAEANNIPPTKLAAEVEELRSKAADPDNVRRPGDEKMDAEMTTGKGTEESHVFEREKASRKWCRSSTRKCGLKLGDKLNIDTDLAISKKSQAEFSNMADLQTKGWLGKELKVGDPLPDGYAWNNGKIFRKPGKVDAGFAPLTLVGNILSIKESAGRISNPATMKRNFKAALAETLKAENPKWTDAKIKAEVAKIADKSAVHHIIPDNVVQDHPLGVAARDAGYNLDRGSNLKGLPKSKELTDLKGGDAGHWSSHPKYDQLVRGELDTIQAGLEKQFGSLDKVPKQRLLDEMKKVEDKFRDKIDKNDVPKKDGRLTELRLDEEMEEVYA